jgi:hypothetical protein
MKKAFFFLLLQSIALSVFAQIAPVHNSQALIREHQVKIRETHYEDAETGEEYLIHKLEFDQQGRVVEEFQLYLWDVVSYTYTTSFRYNDAEKIREKIKIQEILSLFPRDEDYIEMFGDAPVNERVLYQYNEGGQLIKRELYVFYTDEFEESTEPKQVINYRYEDGRIVEEKSISAQDRIFNHNYEIHYDYDSAGNLILQTRKYGDSLELQRQTRFKYDSTGKQVEKKVIDPKSPHNNTHEKYEYNSNGRLTDLYVYSEEEEEFELETTYRYNDQGHMISGNRNVHFEYTGDGLIKSESWTDKNTGKEMKFNSTYQYF